MSNHFLRIYLRYIDLYTSFPAEIPATVRARKTPQTLTEYFLRIIVQLP